MNGAHAPLQPETTQISSSFAKAKSGLKDVSAPSSLRWEGVNKMLLQAAVGDDEGNQTKDQAPTAAPTP